MSRTEIAMSVFPFDRTKEAGRDFLCHTSPNNSEDMLFEVMKVDPLASKNCPARIEVALKEGIDSCGRHDRLCHCKRNSGSNRFPFIKMHFG
jgi:hypothetical protein